MARTYSTLQSLVDSKLGGATGTLTASTFMAGLNATLDYLKSQIDFPEAEKTATLSPALFTDVMLYTAPSDLYGDSILDIRPLVEIPNYSIKNDNQRTTPTEFSNNYLGDRVNRKWAIEYNAGTKNLRIFDNLAGRTINTLLNNCDTYNGDGTWTADTTNSDANTVSTDDVNYFEGSGSVKFNITVGQSVNNRAVIYNPSMNTKDISQMNSPYLFFYVYLPSVTNFTSVTMYVGSDASSTPSTKANYYTFTATTQFDGSALVAGRNLIGVAKSSATSTGTPDDDSLVYLELRLNYTGSYTSQTDVRLDGIYMREGELYEVRYFSNYLVSSVSGTLKQYFTADDDYLILNPDGEMLFVDTAAGYLAPNTNDYQAAKMFGDIAMRSLMQYKSRYPQERKLLMRNWYGSGALI